MVLPQATFVSTRRHERSRQLLRHTVPRVFTWVKKLLFETSLACLWSKAHEGDHAIGGCESIAYANATLHNSAPAPKVNEIEDSGDDLPSSHSSSRIFGACPASRKNHALH